ncbi:flavin monoamine oxidase family protein [Nocardia tengchongensis]|uniref:flavin monoamine oxidase family protein n=1 Tax=Nocardia tengchongensis TaxID=2055889 RepID=UPI0036954D7E
MLSKDEQHEDTYDCDVVVIGAGFAGATVARECATRGLRTIVLEASNRIGGRTHTEALSTGELIDVGGTYVHWSQPHTWSELTRYGLTGDVVEAVSQYHDWVMAPHGDGSEWSTADEHAVREQELVERFFEHATTVFPRPYDPMFNAEAVSAWDHLTVRDRLDELELKPDDDAHLTALLSTLSSEVPERSSYLALLRWYAACGGSYELLFTGLMGSKLKHGTVGLLGAILSDGGAEVRLSTPVRGIASGDHGVEITLVSGAVVTGSVAVVATPSGVWPHLEFSPPLAPERLAVAEAGLQNSWGAKGAAVIKGEPRRLFVQPRLGEPIAILWTTDQRSEGEQLVTFMCSPAIPDPSDKDKVAAELRELLPGIEVVEVHTDSWTADDQYVRGGWPMLAPGVLSRYVPHTMCSAPAGRIVFATADISTLWSSFIDGAIESGLRAARDVQKILR